MSETYRTTVLNTVAHNVPPGSDFVTIDNEIKRIQWAIGSRYGMNHVDIMRETNTWYVIDIMEHVRAWWRR